jgi:hypothetical protein
MMIRAKSATAMIAIALEVLFIIWAAIWNDARNVTDSFCLVIVIGNLTD